MDSAKVIKIQKLEKILADTCQEIYELSMNGRNFTPFPPFVVVRVLPKEHVTEGGIILSDTAQTKTVYEGIVLQTWKPYVEVRDMKTEDGDNMGEYHIAHECSVNIGDRVAFPHSEGLPVGDLLDDRYYRLVREGDEKFDYHRILGTLDYTGDVELQAKIRELTKQFSSVTTSGVALSRGANITSPYGTT
jgi:co-chaperonin GroES (HSP10)